MHGGTSCSHPRACENEHQAPIPDVPCASLIPLGGTLQRLHHTPFPSHMTKLCCSNVQSMDTIHPSLLVPRAVKMTQTTPPVVLARVLLTCTPRGHKRWRTCSDEQSWARQMQGRGKRGCKRFGDRNGHSQNTIPSPRGKRVFNWGGGGGGFGEKAQLTGPSVSGYELSLS